MNKNSENNQERTWKNLGCNHPFPASLCFFSRLSKNPPFFSFSPLTSIYQPSQRISQICWGKIPSFSFLFMQCMPSFQCQISVSNPLAIRASNQKIIKSCLSFHVFACPWRLRLSKKILFVWKFPYILLWAATSSFSLWSCLPYMHGGGNFIK